jgi:hypothetical protein
VNNRNILIFALVSVVALVLGFVLLVIASVAHLNLSSAAFGGIATLVLIGGLVGFVAWLLGLMKTARISRWDWFIAVLLLGPLGALIYGFSGPADRATD